MDEGDLSRHGTRAGAQPHADAAWPVRLGSVCAALAFLLSGDCGLSRASPPTASGDFVDLAVVAPAIRREMRYATADNFLRKAVYPCARCLLRKEAADALARVQRSLAAKGLGLKVWDCYRPPAVQQAMWKIVPDPRFVADPKQGSVHSRGGALDLTLVDASGKCLEMPTAHDDFSAKAYADAAASPEAAANRAALRFAMEAEGFTVMKTEWWHFDAAGSRAWPIVDVALCQVQPARAAVHGAR